MTSNLIEKELQKFQNEAAVKILRDTISQLENLGIIGFLKFKGQARIIDGGRNSSANAAEGMRAAGYSECLEDLVYFADKYISFGKPAAPLKASYGAFNKIIESGDYTKEEIDEYKRTGKFPARGAASE